MTVLDLMYLLATLPPETDVEAFDADDDYMQPVTGLDYCAGSNSVMICTDDTQ